MPAPSPIDGRARVGALLKLAGLTFLSGGLGALIFVAVLRGEGLTFAFQGVAEWVESHPAWVWIIGLSPLVTALLVGYGYTERAIRRGSRASGGAPP